jgi:hypothetical protein
LWSFRHGLAANITRASAVYDERPSLTDDEWLSVLKLSTKWFFNELRQVAISHLSSVDMDAIKRIRFAKEFKVYDCLLEGYHQLVERLERPQDTQGPITAREGKVIGLEVALALSGIAIRRLRGTIVGNVKGDLLTAFKDEFDCIQQAERRFMTRADRAKEQARNKVTGDRPRAKKKMRNPKVAQTQRKQQDKGESEPAEANPRALEEAAPKASGREIVGSSANQAAKQFGGEDIKRMRFEITKKVEELQALELEGWQKERLRKEDQKLQEIAEKVLEEIQESPDAEQAEILERTLMSEKAKCRSKSWNVGWD